MNRKTLSFLIPVCGFALIAGTGFSAWNFTNSSEDETITSDYGTVSSLLTTIGVLETSETFSFVLDQSKDGVDGVTHSDITFKFNVDADYIATYPEAQFEWSAAITASSSNLTSYVELASTSGAIVDGETVALELNYVQDAEPDSLAEYYEMVEALGEELSLTITVTVSVVE